MDFETSLSWEFFETIYVIWSFDSYFKDKNKHNYS